MSTLRCTVRELPQSRRAPARLNHFPRVGVIWMAYSAICLLRLHSPMGEGTKAVKLGCCVFFSFFFCRMCQAAVTQTIPRLPSGCKSLTVCVRKIKKQKKRKKPHYPNGIITPNGKSCLVSRWIMLMPVASVCGD